MLVVVGIEMLTTEEIVENIQIVVALVLVIGTREIVVFEKLVEMDLRKPPGIAVVAAVAGFVVEKSKKSDLKMTEPAIIEATTSSAFSVPPWKKDSSPDLMSQ